MMLPPGIIFTRASRSEIVVPVGRQSCRSKQVTLFIAPIDNRAVTRRQYVRTEFNTKYDGMNLEWKWND